MKLLTKLEYKILLWLEEQYKIIETFQPNTNSLINLLVSGGKDSMSLLYILKEVLNYKKSSYFGKFSLVVTHINHKKRAKESDEDEFFVIEKCLEFGIECYTFNLYKNTDSKELNFQNYARNFRKKISLDLSKKLAEARFFSHFFIFTAHHAGDHAESVLINMARGSGVSGLLGIINTDNGNSPFKKPLANTLTKEITNYIKEKEVSYREDSSNKETKYTRNFIRHNLVKYFNELNPNFEEAMLRMSSHIQKSLEVKDSDKCNKNPMILTDYTSTTDIFNYLKKQKESSNSNLSLKIIDNLKLEIDKFRKGKKESKVVPLKNNFLVTLEHSPLTGTLLLSVLQE